MARLSPVHSVWNVAKGALARINLALAESARHEDLIFRLQSEREPRMDERRERAEKDRRKT